MRGEEIPPRECSCYSGEEFSGPTFDDTVRTGDPNTVTGDWYELSGEGVKSLG